MTETKFAIQDLAVAMIEKPNDNIKHDVSLGGVFKVEHYDKDGNLKGIYNIKNGVTRQGRDYMLDAAFSGGTPITAWYIGLINGDGSFANVDEDDTYAVHNGTGGTGTWTELHSIYSETTRPAWSESGPSNQSLTNNSPVTFTITAGGTVRGIFICSNNTKGDLAASGAKLWSTSLFTSPVTVSNGDSLKITYTINTSVS